MKIINQTHLSWISYNDGNNDKIDKSTLYIYLISEQFNENVLIALQKYVLVDRATSPCKNFICFRLFSSKLSNYINKNFFPRKCQMYQ